MMETTLRSELSEVIEHYEIGDLVDYARNDLGYVNTSYAVETVAAGDRRRYFLRQYKRGIKKQELEFEHSVIAHLVEQNFKLAARVIETREGATFVERKADQGSIFYALFDFLAGEDRYTWVNPVCSDQEIANAATVLAQFHAAVFGFHPGGKRDEPGIVELLPIIAENVTRCAGQSKNTPFDAYFVKNLDPILENIAHTRRALPGPQDPALVQLVIHCDYHPGNLKFQGQEVTGLFDFDWSKIDARCFDVALALLYFFAAWEGERDGAFDLSGVGIFLRAYQNALAGVPGVGALNETEQSYLPAMIAASNLYVLSWTLVDFYSKDVSPDEYLVYLRHGVRTLRWLASQNNRERLKETINSASAPQKSGGGTTQCTNCAKTSPPKSG
jgi:homoserine kinase type II